MAVDQGATTTQSSTELPEILNASFVPDNENDNPYPIRKKAICGVCTSQESQYKCSTCYLPYCSLSCSNTHKASHLVLSPGNSPPSKTFTESEPIPALETPNTLCNSYSRDPFAPLDDSKDLQLLFKLYPNLPNVLEKIYEATLPPVTMPYSLTPTGRASRGRREQPWTSDIGLQRGVKALHAVKGLGDVDGEGVRAYMRLVMDIINGDPERNPAEHIRQEMVDQDTILIKELLDGKI